MNSEPASVPTYQHLLAIADQQGVFEHCLLDRPRIEHGYCVDDVARALIVAVRDPAPDLQGLAGICSAFLLQSQARDGRVVNRRDAGGRWHGEPSTEDHWGRALWAWGTAARSADPQIAEASAEAFARSARLRSRFTRSMVFAGLGAAEMLRADPGHETARELLADAVAALPLASSRDWPWPEDRLTYANAALPELMIAAAEYFEDHAVLREGLALLHWLVDLQTRDGHLSVVPAGGWAPGEPLPGFDQQPIEVAALVDASVRAAEATGDAGWRSVVRMGADWLAGDNDAGVPMLDPRTGAGFDGLESAGRNENRGAESTLAALSILQHRAAA